MDLFLSLYVVGLMVMFFFLGAAIGGVARCLKAHFFGASDGEVFANVATSFKEREVVSTSAIGATALGGVATGLGLEVAQRSEAVTEAAVHITSDTEDLNPVEEWAAPEGDGEAEVVDVHSEVIRGEDSAVQVTSDIETAQPLEDQEIPAREEFQGAEVFRSDDEDGVTIQADLQEDVAETHEAATDVVEDVPEAEDEVERAADINDVEFIADGDDDLTLIRGIDENMNAALQAYGVRQFKQIAQITPIEVEFLQSRLGLDNQLQADGWIEQAKILESGALTHFAAVKVGEVASNEAEPEVAAEPEVEAVAVVEPIAETEVAVEPEVETEAVVEGGGEVSVSEDQPEADAPIEAIGTEDAPIEESSVAEDAGALLAARAAAEAVFKTDDASSDAGEVAAEEDVSSVVENVEEVVVEATETTPENEETGELAEEETSSEDDGRLFSREARERRNGNGRKSYDNDRVIVAPTGQANENGDVVEAAESEVAADEVTETAGDGVEIVAPVVAGPVEDDASRPVDSDDLKQISHISIGLEKKLNLLGVYKLSQISGWSSDDIADISEQLELRGRIEEENWVEQASQALKDGDASDGSNISPAQLVARLAELDNIDDLTEHEKALLANHGITSLSQIANWSGADQGWVVKLLSLDEPGRIDGWIASAQSLLGSGAIAAPGGEADGDEDLKRIRGIDEETETVLKDAGVSTYNQIAGWEQADMDRINDLLGTSGRVERQYWVVQAKVLKDGGSTDFSKLYDSSSDAV